MAKKRIKAKLVKAFSVLFIATSVIGTFFFNPIAKETDLLTLDEVKDTVEAVGGDNSYADYSQNYKVSNVAHRFYAKADDPINVNILIKNLTDEEKQTIRAGVDEIFAIAHAINPDYNYELRFVDEQEISIIDKMTNCINVIKAYEPKIESQMLNGFIKNDYKIEGAAGGSEYNVRQVLTDDGVCATNALITLSSNMEREDSYTYVLQHEILHALCGLGENYMVETDTASIMGHQDYISYNDVVLMCAKLQKKDATINLEEVFKLTNTYKRMEELVDTGFLKSTIAKFVGNDASEINFGELKSGYYNNIHLGKSSENEDIMYSTQISIEDNVFRKDRTDIVDGKLSSYTKENRVVSLKDNVYYAGSNIITFYENRMYLFTIYDSNDIFITNVVEYNSTKEELAEIKANSTSIDYLKAHSKDVKLCSVENINKVLEANGIATVTELEQIKEGYYKNSYGLYVSFKDNKLEMISSKVNSVERPIVLDSGVMKDCLGCYIFVANGTMYRKSLEGSYVDKLEEITQAEYEEQLAKVTSTSEEAENTLD